MKKGDRHVGTPRAIGAICICKLVPDACEVHQPGVMIERLAEAFVLGASRLAEIGDGCELPRDTTETGRKIGAANVPFNKPPQ